ncbi:MAG TPA: 6-bladed beta-propeller [Acidobacteriota bacterium]|nr:6-bladed beta-propeller [Acidobacteriota bacterium]
MTTNRGLGFVVAVTVLVAATISIAAEPKLVAAFFLKGKVGLKWQKVADVTEYIVYRKETGAEFRKIATLDDDRYFDTELTPGTVYVYRIAGVGPDGGEVYSNEKTVTIPEAAAGSFFPPNWVGLRLEQDKVFLNWDQVPGAIAYNVHRSLTPGEGYEIVGNTRTSKYADKEGLEKGNTYYYVLTALNADFEETEMSEERHIKYGLSLEEQDALLMEQDQIVLEPVVLTQLFVITEAGPDGAMNQPADVFVNSQGNIYVTDALNGRIHCFDPGGKHLFSFGELMDKSEADDPPPGAFQIPFTLFIDKQDQVYVTDIDQHDVQVFAAGGQFIRRIRVAVEDGKVPLRPNGIHVLDDGRIVMTDTGNHRFLIVDGGGKILRSVGEEGDGDGQFRFPDELTVTPDGIICIVDVINCRIQQFDLEGQFIRAFGEIGQSAGTFARPKAITVDGAGRIWVSDGMSSVIQSFTPDGMVKSALGTMNDEIRFVTPRGLFFRGDRFYVVNRVPHQIVVYRVG